MIRGLVYHFDAFLRHLYGVSEFSEDERCLLRVQFAQASRDLELSGGFHLRKGAPVLLLHLWNEHLPRMAVTGPDVAWAAQVHQGLKHSLRALARWMGRDVRAGKVCALGGVMALGDGEESSRLLRRLGFDVFPYRGPLRGFGVFWENLYSWALMWAYNPGSLRGRCFWALQRVELWIAREEFERRYGMRL